MKFININSIGDYPEDFLIAKVDIERLLLENEEIQERMKLDQFVIWLDLQKSVYVKSQKSVAFSIRNGESDDYIFYSILDPEEGDELFESFKKKMEKIKYRIDSLKKIDNTELLDLDLSKEEVFVINYNLHK